MKVKFPRTYHFSFSETITSDDKIIADCSGFEGEEVVISEKKDGENTTLYANGESHARSLDSPTNLTRNWVKSFHQQFAYLMLPNERVCGENLWAQHSIPYDNLESYFYGFSVWHGQTALSWDDTISRFNELGIVSVPVLYRGPFDEKIVKKIFSEMDLEKQEGLVCRVTRAFDYSEYSRVVAKCVRQNHVQTDEHWMHGKIIQNRLKK